MRILIFLLLLALDLAAAEKPVIRMAVCDDKGAAGKGIHA
jgi:hypothetical protein